MGSNDVMLTRQELSGIQTVTLVRPPVREYFVTAALTAAASPRDVFDKAAAFVRAQGAQILSLEVFGIAGHDAAGWEELCNVFGPVRWPVTWLENSPEARLGGIQLWAVSGAEPAAVELDGVVVGNTLETEGRRWCRLGGLRPASRDGRRGEQARDIFDKMEDVLHTVGMEFRQVVRTWFYNDCILDWYDEFNRVRDTFFDERHVYDGLVPASTAVGGRNPARTALVGGLLAVDGGQSDLSVAAVPSPLQCPALEYGSSFSRAVEVGTGDRRRLFVSGTASIAAEGHTVHVGDVRAQVAQTMDVVHAILESRGMGWAETIRGLAYMKRGADAAVFTDYCRANGMPFLPVVLTQNDICRDDLLFELEVDAAAGACGRGV